MNSAFHPFRAKTHLEYARRLLGEAMEAQRLGHVEETIEKSRTALEHAVKAIFNIAGIEFEAYRSLEEAVAKGLKDALDTDVHTRLLGALAHTGPSIPGQDQTAQSIENTSFAIGKAAALIGNYGT